MKKISKIFALALALMLLLSVLPAALAADGTVVYLDPNIGWKDSSARFAAYWWSDNGSGWVDMVADGDYYTGTIPAGATGMIFCRMDPATTENKWENKWNQSGNLTVPTDNKNCFSLPYGSWDNDGDANWYVKGSEPYNDGLTGPISYYVAGESTLCGSNWNEKDEANKMTENADGLYEKSYSDLPSGTYQFKITNGTWSDSVGGDGPGGNYQIILEQNSNITILFNADTKEISVKIIPLDTEVPEYTVTIHFMPPLESWGTSINAWVWAGNAALPGYEEYHTEWPGKAVEADAENPGWYTIQVTTTYANGFSFIFNAGEGKAQTSDLSTGALSGDVELWYYGDEAYTEKPSTIPATGESTPLALVIGLMTVSAAAVVLLKKKAI